MKTIINSLDNFGRGIGKYNDKVVFIPYTLVGEEVEFEILLEKKKFIEGKLIKVIKESESRIKSSCPYFGLCGGCQLLHMSYDDEILYKENKISPALVIGVPVGFVNVVEAKEMLISSGMPYIAARGRKGGSNVAAAIVNALIYKIKR